MHNSLPANFNTNLYTINRKMNQVCAAISTPGYTSADVDAEFIFEDPFVSETLKTPLSEEEIVELRQQRPIDGGKFKMPFGRVRLNQAYHLKSRDQEKLSTENARSPTKTDTTRDSSPTKTDIWAEKLSTENAPSPTKSDTREKGLLAKSGPSPTKTDTTSPTKTDILNHIILSNMIYGRVSPEVTHKSRKEIETNPEKTDKKDIYDYDYEEGGDSPPSWVTEQIPD